MAYKSPVKNVYYQSTSAGRPSTPRKTELGEIANALDSFSVTMGKYVTAQKSEDQKNAQAVFDKLKMEGITNPDDIQKLIEANDPKVEGLQKYWAKAVIDTNFAITHALDDGDAISANIYKTIGNSTETGLTFADVDLDQEFKNVERDFSEKSTSYVRAYTEAFQKIQLDFQDKKLVADAERLNLEKRSAAHTQLTHAWDNTKPEDRWTAIQLWYQDKTSTTSKGNKNGKGFLLAEEANRLILNFLEERVQTTSSATELMSIKEMLIKQRLTKNKELLPSFKDDLVHQTQATKIWKLLLAKQKTMLSNANVEQMYFEGVAHKSVYNGENISDSKKKLAETSILNKITALVEQEAYTYNNNNPNLPKFDKEIRIDSYIASIMSKNSVVFTPWKEELEHALGVINNTNIFDIDNVENFMIGYNRFKKLKRLGQDNNPKADYLTGREELFYEGVLALERTGTEVNQAVAKMWQFINNDDYVKEFEAIDNITDMREAIDNYFDAWGWDDTTETNPQVQEAMRIAKILRITGVPEATAYEQAAKMVTDSYISVDGILWNRRKMPNGNKGLEKELTVKSQEISKIIEDKYEYYDEGDLVLAPWFGNMYVVMERNTRLPAQVDGKAFAFTYAEVFGDGENSLSKMLADNGINKAHIEKNAEILKILDDKDMKDLKNLGEKELKAIEEITTFDEKLYNKKKNK